MPTSTAISPGRCEPQRRRLRRLAGGNRLIGVPLAGPMVAVQPSSRDSHENQFPHGL